MVLVVDKRVKTKQSSQILKQGNAGAPIVTVDLKMFKNSVRVKSLYLAGFCSDRSSLMGPYESVFVTGC